MLKTRDSTINKGDKQGFATEAKSEASGCQLFKMFILESTLEFLMLGFACTPGPHMDVRTRYGQELHG